MNAILNFFIEAAPFIYILLAMGLVIGLRRLVSARAEMREAVYGLEREIAQGHTNQAVTTLTLIGVFAVAEFVLIVFLKPMMPAIFRLPTPTIVLANQTGAPASPAQETMLAQTPMLTPASASTGCVPGSINISSPKSGDEIKGTVTLTGDASISDFGFYKYEFAPYGSDSWSAVEANRAPKKNETLGTWDTSAILPGDYNLRLVVTDNAGNQLTPCVITVRIKAP